MMKKLLIVVTSLVLGLGSAQLVLAKKPDDAGNKGAMKEHKSEKHEMRKNDRDGKSDDRSDDRSDDKSDDKSKSDKKGKKDKSRDDRSDDRSSDQDKHLGKKADQERKELGKGSEQGQAAREEHSRKWWQF
ncbi:hypothetical protein LCGC14_2625800 [marine sediment metagenome]|uniref:Uncharacterized protein n=1 Tax=marine sediment metagenome TaxID=412755 RepID=A0A0F9A1T8_9ZZZZ